MAIDIGAGAADYNSLGDANYTELDKTNPVNADGKIDTHQAYLEVACTANGKIGVFFLISGTTYRCRDSENVGSISAGSVQTFTGLFVDAKSTDIIGTWLGTDGKVSLHTTGGSGIGLVSGDNCDRGDEATYTFNGAWSEYKLALYGTGTEAAHSKYFMGGSIILPSNQEY